MTPAGEGDATANAAWSDSGTDLGTPSLRWEQRGSVAYCTIDRAEHRNAMTPAMYQGLRRAVRRVERTPELAALVITGTGDVFSPGGDMGAGRDGPDAEAVATMAQTLPPFEDIRNCTKPVVAMVNGLAQGGGGLLAIVADVAVVSERARFRVPEILRGVADSWWAAYLPAHVGLARARSLLLTGRTIDAAEAYAMGLVAHVVPHDELEAATAMVVGDLVRAGPEAFWQTKRMLNARYGNVDLMTFSSTVFGPEAIEGFRAFLERRPPAWIPEDFATDERL